MSIPKPVVLCILDGWGESPETAANAPFLAKTPNFDAMKAHYPHTTLKTHGADVGLPQGQMGNSEVGHMNIGAGRVVSMDLGRIDRAIETGAFAANPTLQDFIATLKGSKGAAHLLGVLSDGGVHGHLRHLLEAAQVIAQAQVPVVLHAITDGRDVAPCSALTYLETAEAHLPTHARIGTLIGRYFAMDRDNRWERVAQAYHAMVRAVGQTASDARAAIKDAYACGQTDEFIAPTVLDGYHGMGEGDGLFCLNFRADRVRQILAAIGQPDFTAFQTGPRPALSALVGMAEYSKAHSRYMGALYPQQDIVNTLGAWVAQHGRRQYRLAETEKYPHVTFFFNGGIEPPYAGEDRFMAPSPKVATYDLQPEMAAAEISDKLVQAIAARYDLIVVNYANPDMVGHTGRLDAAIRACEAVDAGLGQAWRALRKVGGVMIVTADHGNCETMVDAQTGGPHTAHTTNLVPVVLVNGPEAAGLRTGGRLADLAPTLLALMGLPQPEQMRGQSLLTY
ncbi:MAG: 2,3-bisphosphoglycerate-independent phosphoglycerate mutase [Rhodobacteraceae bacterium]|nr:2,3-bisphosphoglycerate-independent phosphoglycerate mutase [Paracoccaceae bacterium]